jgi:hypothetical protein
LIKSRGAVFRGGLDIQENKFIHFFIVKYPDNIYWIAKIFWILKPDGLHQAPIL